MTGNGGRGNGGGGGGQLNNRMANVDSVMALTAGHLIVRNRANKVAILYYYYFKWAIASLFSVYFWSFKTNIITIFITNKCEKCPSGIRCRDLKPQPLEREPLSITTRPGLPPFFNSY